MWIRKPSTDIAGRLRRMVSRTRGERIFAAKVSFTSFWIRFLGSRVVIYFIEIVGEDHVKIGYTSQSIGQRLSQLQVASPKPMRVLATCDGNKETEVLLHLKFQEDLIRGEWYHLSDAILDFIEGCGDYKQSASYEDGVYINDTDNNQHDYKPMVNDLATC